MKGKKILAGLAVASLVVCGGVGMAACCDDSTVVATAEEFAEAIANAEDGEVIKLTANIDIDSSIIIDKEITINLNGKTIEAGDEISNIAMFFVRNEGKLTFDGEGIVDAATSANDYSMAVWAYSGGEVVINNGTFTNLGGKSVEDNGTTPNNNELIYATGGGVITINGGTFIGNYENAKWGTRYTLNMLDGSDADITVTGGKFYQFNPAESLSEYPQANFVADGCDVELIGDYYVVTKA